MRQIHDVVNKPFVSCEVLGFRRGVVQVFAVQECWAGVDSYCISNYLRVILNAPIDHNTIHYSLVHIQCFGLFYDTTLIYVVNPLPANVENMVSSD
jgi:hypothetical protein